MKNLLTLFLGALLTLQYSCRLSNGIPDLKPTYASRDTKPFGGYIAKRLLENCFRENYLQSLKLPFERNESVSYDTASFYFCLTPVLYITQPSTVAILNFVDDGNTAFISAASFDTIFLNRISCKVTDPGHFNNQIEEGYWNTYLHLNDAINAKDSFGYFYHPFKNFFSVIPGRSSRVLCYNDFGKPNCILLFIGKGRLILHCDPAAFSNYFLLTKNNYHYMRQLMQINGESPQHVYWDNYYHTLTQSQGNKKDHSTLSEIFKYPSLKVTFWLLVALLALYIFSGIKRKQRIIPEIRANQNSSVAFTETIARLYLQKHDNKNIAEKMISYFNEYLRTRFFLNMAAPTIETINTLSRKSGIDENKITDLFTTINLINNKERIDDAELLALDNQIQQFYKK